MFGGMMQGRRQEPGTSTAADYGPGYQPSGHTGCSPAPRAVGSNRIALCVLAVAACLSWAAPAEAYIGPGAGFAVASSLFTILITMLGAMLTLLIWPIRWATRPA